MNKTRIIILAALVAVAIVAWYGWHLYDKPTPKAAEAVTEITIDATALMQAFQTDEAAAGKAYNDKVVEVTGRVREVSSDSGGPVTMYLETGDGLGVISCECAPGMQPKPPGTEVTIKGFCAGYNMDVELKRCAIVE
jgi:hypothetical protein